MSSAGIRLLMQANIGLLKDERMSSDQLPLTTASHLAEAVLKASGCMFRMSELSQSILARLTFSISANWSEYQLVERTLDNTTSRRVDNLNALVCSVYLNALFPIRCTSISTLNY